MIAIHITNTKEFMNQFLRGDNFDSFLLSEALIETYNTFTINGRLNSAFYNNEEQLAVENSYDDFSFSIWKDMKPFCYELIKGKKTPVSFKFVLKLAQTETEILLQEHGIRYSLSDINGLFLNLKFDQSGLQCISGTSLKCFTLDKTLEQEWDHFCIALFQKNEISFEQL